MSTVAVTRLVEAPVVAVWRVFTDLPSRVRLAVHCRPRSNC